MKSAIALTILCILLVASISGCISCPYTNRPAYPTVTPIVTATTPPPPPPPPAATATPTIQATPTATAPPTPTPTPVPTATPTVTPKPTVTATPTPKPTQLPAPALSSPASNQTIVNPPKNVTFSWNSVPHATAYRLEVEENVSGWVSRVNTQVTGTTYSKTLGFGSTQWRWRVTAIGSGTYTNSTPSSWRYFRFVIG